MIRMNWKWPKCKSEWVLEKPKDSAYNCWV